MPLMKIKLLIATDDSDYSEYLSNVLTDKYADTFEVTVCSSVQLLNDLLKERNFDVALLAASFCVASYLSSIRLPFLLWEGSETAAVQAADYRRISKYQRISSLAGNVLEACAEISIGGKRINTAKAYWTAVWSPSGGVGKTTVALAYATRKVADGQEVLYLNLEHFSSSPLYFAETGKSISVLFEKLDGNAELLVRALSQQDRGTGIRYFCHPENYDDINVLSAEDILILLKECSAGMDEIVIDLPCICDERIRQIFEIADKVILVTDATKTSQTKLEQFVKQHNVFEQIQAKTVLIANKGAIIDKNPLKTAICLPHVAAGNAIEIYKTLSSNRFEV